MLSFLRFFKNPEVQAFAESLVQQLIKRYPPALDNEPTKRPSVNRLTRIIEDTCARSVEFQRTRKLGWLGKARLGNHFRWAMLEAGYRKEFAELATEAVVLHISRSGPAASDSSK